MKRNKKKRKLFRKRGIQQRKDLRDYRILLMTIQFFKIVSYDNIILRLKRKMNYFLKPIGKKKK